MGAIFGNNYGLFCQFALLDFPMLQFDSVWQQVHYICFIDEPVKRQKAPIIVIPVKTGIQENQSRRAGRFPLPDRSRGQASRE